MISGRITIQFCSRPVISIIKFYDICISRIIQFCFILSRIFCWCPGCMPNSLFFSCFIHSPDWLCHCCICSNRTKLGFITNQNIIGISDFLYNLSEIISSFIIRWVCTADILCCFCRNGLICQQFRCIGSKCRGKHIIMCFTVSKIRTIFQIKHLTHTNFFCHIILIHNRFLIGVLLTK